jgi:hypothetical protein
MMYVPVYFPMVATYAYINRKNNRFSRGFTSETVIASSLVILIILSAICLTSLYSTNQAGETSVTKLADVESSFQWSFSHIDGESRQIFADFNILGKTLQYESKEAKPSFLYEYLTTNVYAVLVGDKSVSEKLQGQ